eukprot:TRINITY_DN104468_c0_g1_i1.p1 TRINITY_DN104468_c0_g1~~TRINITY_DN104468_c0_g1_i1.p1  ORF type:complete len:466 (-),score=69.84 TRINITY_DN104468_c0_g1_i1:52-1392(-)
MSLLLSLVAANVFWAAAQLLGAPKMFDGRYTIRNVVTGRSIVSSSDGFQADSAGGPLTEEHMWKLLPQENGSHIIVNSANGGRILAQAASDWNRGFFAVAQGPIYQDQKWQLVPQEDGSFAIRNMKSGRRMSTLSDADRPQGFGAVLPDMPFNRSQAWWLINQDWDEGARLRLELRASRLDLETLARELDASRAETRSLTLHLDRQFATSADSVAPEFAHLLCSQRLVLVALGILIALVGIVAGTTCHRTAWKSECEQARVKMEELEAKLDEQGSRGDSDAQQVSEETGFGFDFGFRVLDAKVANGTSRLVKIQCPGVEHRDVEIELLFNGCQVTIHRRASCGLEATTWKKQFEFPPREGLFEFKEDQMRLEHGFLHLVFRAYAFQSRVVRFPSHFALEATDSDLWWDYPDDDACTPQVSCHNEKPTVPIATCTESTVSSIGGQAG